MLRMSGTDVLLNYLPVGSEKATRFYAQCALEAGAASRKHGEPGNPRAYSLDSEPFIMTRSNDLTVTGNVSVNMTAEGESGNMKVACGYDEEVQAFQGIFSRTRPPGAARRTSPQRCRSGPTPPAGW